MSNTLIKSLVVSFITLLPLGKAYGKTEPTTSNRYELDQDHTKVGFEIPHLVIATVDGQFKKFSGSFGYNESTNELIDPKIEIDVASIDTNQEKRDKHLRNEDFFNVDKFPKITFENIKLQSTNKTPKKLTGILNMRGQKKEISLDVDFKGFATDAWGNKKIVFNLSGKINRKDFGLTWNKSLETGGVLVGDEVTLIIKAEANQKKS